MKRQVSDLSPSAERKEKDMSDRLVIWDRIVIRSPRSDRTLHAATVLKPAKFQKLQLPYWKAKAHHHSWYTDEAWVRIRRCSNSELVLVELLSVALFAGMIP